MGRKRQKKKQRNARKGGYSRKANQNGGHPPYEDIEKCNDLFEKYYMVQGIVPEEEWDLFMAALRCALPAAFRITPFLSESQYLLHIIQGEYFQELLNVNDNDGEAAKPISLPWYPGGMAWQLDLSRVTIRKSKACERLHSFLTSESTTGGITRQETVSMLPPLLLDVKPHHKILDMCASPGSKTAQLMEMLQAPGNTIPEGVVVANDKDNKRCYMLVHQAKRLKSTACVVTNHDGAIFPNMYLTKEDGTQEVLKYDRVLCDVPCTGDGTLRKNTDLWRKWNVANGNNNHGLQARLLRRGLELLVEGGLLVYSTCSMNPVENEAVVSSILQQCGDVVELVDARDSLSGLVSNPGLTKWKVANKNVDIYSSFDEVPEEYRTQIRPCMFPPPPDVAAQLHLDRCIRILPHHQDTGAFFLAVIKKLGPKLPWESSKAPAGDAPAVKEEINEEEEEPEWLGVPKKSRHLVRDKDRPLEASLTHLEDPNLPGGESHPEVGLNSSRPRSHPKPQHRGFKEDPFVFLSDDDIIWTKVRGFFGIDERFPNRQLMGRCEQESKRNIYLVSKTARNIIETNGKKIKIVNTGVRVFCRCEGKELLGCDYRICQEGIPTMLPYLNKRMVLMTRRDVHMLLTEEYPLVAEFSHELQEQLKVVAKGCLLLAYKRFQGTPDEFEVVLAGRRGKATVRCYVGQEEKVHYLRICGFDVSAYEKRGAKEKGVKAVEGGDTAEDMEETMEEIIETMEEDPADDTTETAEDDAFGTDDNAGEIPKPMISYDFETAVEDVAGE